jgi:LysM repeat protein
MNRMNRSPVLLVLASLLAAGITDASEIVHRVEPGETLTDIARKQWGEPGWAELLRTHNDLGVQPLREGQELRIPTPEERIAEEGDSWGALARLTLGDAVLGPVLAELNGLPSDEPPPVGATILVPAIAVYRLQRGETLAAVARRFLSGTGDWKLLARLNQFGNPHALAPGTKVKIPLPTRAASTKTPSEQSAPPAATKATPAPSVKRAAPEPDPKPHVGARGPAVPEAPPPRFEEAIRVGVNAYLDGRYEEARDELEKLRPEVERQGSPEERRTLLEYLTRVYVAFEDVERACDAYAALHAADPEHSWNRDRISPKVIRLTSLCETR